MPRPRARSDSLPGGYPPGAEAFLPAIIAAPADDTPRLVFADWLQENGDEDRAEFVRAQIELQNRQPDWDAPKPGLWDDPKVKRAALPPEAEALYTRQRDLLARNRTRWLAGHPRWAFAPLWQSFRRGFPRAIRAKAEDWRRDGPALRKWFPLEVVTLECYRGDFAGMFATGSLTGLNRLELLSPNEACLRALAVATPLRVEAIHLAGDHQPSAAVVRGAVGAAALAGVHELRCRFAHNGDAIGSAIADSPHLSDLQNLVLGYGMGTIAAVELFASPSVANLTDLCLPNNSIGDEGIRALVASHATNLVRLGLWNTSLTDDAARLLAAWQGLGTVESLDLNGNLFSLDGLTALSESPHIGRLRVLYVGANPDAENLDRVRALPGFAHAKIEWGEYGGMWR